MASIFYDSFHEDNANGDYDPGADTTWIMLVDNTYAPDKGVHDRRDDITGEVVGAGYSAGGKVITLTVAVDTMAHQTTITPSTVSWAAATITARGAVLYKRRGGASSADELLGYVDFGADITSTADTFTVTFSSPFTIQN